MIRDAELLRRYAHLDSEEDFTALVRRHAGLVYGCALRQLGDRGLAEDVTQLAFVALARHARNLCERENLCGWLFTTTRYISCKMLREAGRRVRREREEIMILSHHEPPSELGPVMDDVLCELKALDREIVLLRFYSGLRFPEISERLNLSQNALQKRTDRALDLLREMLARRGITSSGAALVAALEVHGAVVLPAGLATSAASAALAAQAVAGPAAFSFVMATSKLKITLAALCLGSGFFFLVRQVDTARDLRAEIGITSLRTQALRETTARKADSFSPSKVNPVAPAPASLANRPPVNAGLVNRSAPASSSPPSATAAKDPAERGRAFFEKNPAARELWEETERSATLVRFVPLLADLNLSSQQREQFLEIMNRGRFSIMMTEDGGLIKFQNSQPLSLQETDESLKHLLGDPAYDRYREYLRIQPALDLAVRFAALVNGTDPIARTPAAELVKILAEASADYRQGNNAKTETIDWTAALERAREILSPAQLSLLTTLKLQSESDRAVTEYVVARAAANKSTK